jgi:hypothetical protein
MSIFAVTLRVRAFVFVQFDELLERENDASVVGVPMNRRVSQGKRECAT